MTNVITHIEIADNISMKAEAANNILLMPLKVPYGISDIINIILAKRAHNTINAYAEVIIRLPDFKSYLINFPNMQTPP